MSPGATFERVYHELKRMLAEGELPPGTAIEPALIGKQIASSITPIRDALHRLTGERLVEAPNHNGFRVPLPTEAALRDLYTWNGLLLGLAAKQLSPRLKLKRIEHRVAIKSIASSTAELFLEIAQGGESAELASAVSLLNDRLMAFRHAEVAALPSVSEELAGFGEIAANGDRSTLTAALTRYHRRRIASVAEILARSTQPMKR
jgi:DNA-binding GntR family transcriptional regulator